MTNLLKIISTLFERSDIKPSPIVHARPEIKDPVYHFFFEEKADERKKEFDRALKAADEDQKKIIRKYEEVMQKDLLSA